MSPHAAEHGLRRRLKGCDEKVMSDTFLLAGRSIAHAGSLFLTPPMINASGIVPCLPTPPHPPPSIRAPHHGTQRGCKSCEKRKKKAHECTCIIICGVCACVCVYPKDLQSVHVYRYMQGERDIKRFVRQSVSDDERKEFYSSSGGAAFQNGAVHSQCFLEKLCGPSSMR